MNGTEPESVHCVTDLGVSIASSHKFSQQCKDAAGKAKHKHNDDTMTNLAPGLYKQKFLV